MGYSITKSGKLEHKRLEFISAASCDFGTFCTKQRICNVHSCLLTVLSCCKISALYFY